MNMLRRLHLPLVGVWLALAVMVSVTEGAKLPDSEKPLPSPPLAGQQTAVLAGGCFWGVNAVFQHLKGVSQVVSGYAGGDLAAPSYEAVSRGTTGHAEAVSISYDPAKISYSQLLEVFFSVAHDPTEKNRQGPDSGTQYRSAVFYANEAQKEQALAYIDQLNKARAFPAPIVTEVVPLKRFYPAEDYHQNYLARHPHEPYIVINDLPKLQALRQRFPALYQ
jgi:peptide-methionine (S)-S-oxide reductase